MSWDTIAFDVDDRGVATITVDRPEQLNALTAETLEAIEDALDEAAERDARVLVIAGAGDEAFVAGADISHMVDLSTPEAQAYAELGHRVADAIETFPAPTIAAVDGYAFGGGCELALACDLRVAAESAVLGQTEIDLGIIPGWGGTQRLPALVGDEVARRLIFLGERIDATEAAEVGFVGEVVADDDFEDRIDDLAGELAAKPATALRAAKEALNAAGEGSAATGLALERRAWAGLFGTHDQREGMTAFLEKRDPEFE
ncbi:enoyl-CoA hydratase-related protein [Halorubrum ezzemoulense]|uniref:enoyl-CoA hydratase/isomerase family protein n=1 Tax=Halorubrum ezzemoulense TaxID=337243 RepID=UPI00232AE214|nr:enoyl-CoA hydratase-related protein [Halorubrum ezzemoulense]MDB2241530.1 enoyl-CoA hydratase-related protein [Halorubrum ezzemoulense]MDB2281508.1 enoyl-CoA hydratase-related protein [Halorubrum ezzemoulense]MDB9247826.1 enoyl-CoA hydratase-related protein [Halorubrum ezzemoulense]MDB9251969.1 enoyl-CoA hydratase-related protein [Halorubrum ezzemoulense]MDB9254603.1 enoyl-CoA hydratase-related protein [Halorubrum ezzemoulense]